MEKMNGRRDLSSATIVGAVVDAPGQQLIVKVLIQTSLDSLLMIRWGVIVVEWKFEFLFDFSSSFQLSISYWSVNIGPSDESAFVIDCVDDSFGVALGSVLGEREREKGKPVISVCVPTKSAGL